MDNADIEMVKLVDRMEKDLLAMKSSQPIGSNSVRVYETLTNFIWDYDYTMTSANYDGIRYGHGMQIKFISRNQSAPFGSLRIQAKINGVTYDPVTAHNNFGGVTNGPDLSYITINEDIQNTGNLYDYALDNTLRWRINTSAASAGTNIQIKLIVTATDMGRIQVRLFNTFA